MLPVFNGGIIVFVVLQTRDGPPKNTPVVIFHLFLISVHLNGPLDKHTAFPAPHPPPLRFVYNLLWISSLQPIMAALSWPPQNNSAAKRLKIEATLLLRDCLNVTRPGPGMCETSSHLRKLEKQTIKLKCEGLQLWIFE